MATTPLKAIRAKCLDCSGDSANEVKLCTIEWCPLYPFRLGKNPNRKGIGGNINQSVGRGTSEEENPT